MNNSKSDPSLKVGVTVQLKSGGPIMTISKYDGRVYFTCLWFTQDQDKVRDGLFPADSLRRYIDEDEI